VNEVLFDDCGFRGNTQDYYNDRNSFLTHVVERRVGIPISLCVLWASVAQRLGLDCALCAQMPRHVILRVDENRFVDAFNRKALDLDSVRTLCTDIGVPFQPDFVVASPSSQVFMRMLRNLIMIYQQRGDVERCCGVLMHLHALDPSDAHLREQVIGLMKSAGRESGLEIPG
jgi:regulator of sirC expression with transglutaminase-like and TPR domain